MGSSFYPKIHPEQLHFLKDLSRRITTGSFESEGHSFFLPTVSPGVDAEEMDGERPWFPLDVADGSEGLDLVRRFSRSSAEEVCTMLYRFAVEYGCLSEETFRLIDNIVPAILKRDTPRQVFELSNVQQFNNNPGTVVNNGG